MKTIPALDALTACLGKLPGVGRRSAERLALSLASQPALRRELEAALSEVGSQVGLCSRCGALTRSGEDPCRLCSDPARDGSVVCVVEDPGAVLQIERAGAYRGRYHVLGGTLSPGQGTGPQALRVDALVARIGAESIGEVIVALNMDVESEATASFLRERLAALPVTVSRPAMGIPAGGGIAYSDAVTLGRALRARQAFDDAR